MLGEPTPNLAGDGKEISLQCAQSHGRIIFSVVVGQKRGLSCILHGSVFFSAEGSDFEFLGLRLEIVAGNPTVAPLIEGVIRSEVDKGS